APLPDAAPRLPLAHRDHSQARARRRLRVGDGLLHQPDAARGRGRVAAEDKRRGVARLAASIAAAVAMIASAVASFPSMRVAYYRRALEGPDERARRAAAKKLASLGERGMRALESIALSDE